MLQFPVEINKKQERLLALVGILECASARQLHQIALANGRARARWNPLTQQKQTRSGVSYSAAKATMQRLREMGLVSVERFGIRGQCSQGYALTELGRTATPGLAQRIERTDVTSEAAQRGWIRSEFWAFAARTEGFSCDQSAEARDNLARSSRNEIERLGPLPYDILQVQTNQGPQTWLLVVDDPRWSPAEFVEKLPIHIEGGPRVGVFVKPSNDGSVWHEQERRWITVGPRFRDLVEHLKLSPQYRGLQPKVLEKIGNLRVASTG